MAKRKITTASGAVYTHDTTAGTLTRNGSYSPGIDYGVIPDDIPHKLAADITVTVGESIEATFMNGKWRVTTPVVSIETLEED